MHWNTQDLVDAIASGLQRAAHAADLEHAISSLDAHNELGLHPVIHRSLAVAGHGVWPEVRYPSDRQDRRRNRGRRCDVVLTPDGRPLGVEADTTPPLFPPAQHTPHAWSPLSKLDGVAGCAGLLAGAGTVAEPALPYESTGAATGSASLRQAAKAPTDPASTCRDDDAATETPARLSVAADATDTSPVALSEAYWMEIKTAMQFTAEGPHRGYTQRLLQAASADILKMSADPWMVHAGLLMVLFARDETVARHDVHTWHTRCMDRDYPLGFPAASGFALNDRLGNGHVLISLFPVR